MPRAEPAPDVQLEHGYTRVANQLLTAIALAPWDSAAQCKVVTALVRTTYGMRRRDAPIGLAAWRTQTDQSDACIKRALDALQSNGVMVVVREADSKRMIPKTWRLQKDFTRWNRFRVSVDDVGAAESVATQGLQATPGTKVNPGSSTTPGTDVNPGSQAYPAPGSSTTPGPGSSTRGGSPPEPMSPNGSRAPKERKERKDRSRGSKPLAGPPPVAGGREGESPGGEPPGPDLRAQDREVILRVWHLGRETVEIAGSIVGLGLELAIRDELVKLYGEADVSMALPHVRATEQLGEREPISLRLPEQRPEVMQRMMAHGRRLRDPPAPRGTRGKGPTKMGDLLAAAGTGSGDSG